MTARRSGTLAALRSRTRALLAAVLPALLLRALIPYGFMPVAGADGLALELCPGAAHSATAGHAHEHHHHGSAGVLSGSAHGLCVFAASAAPALSPVVHPVLPPTIRVCGAFRPSSESTYLPSILRAQSARAPPLMA
jgi:hypothetical protein